jgi:predicted component of type VI protein secretion system
MAMVEFLGTREGVSFGGRLPLSRGSVGQLAWWMRSEGYDAFTVSDALTGEVLAQWPDELHPNELIDRLEERIRMAARAEPNRVFAQAWLDGYRHGSALTPRERRVLLARFGPDQKINGVDPTR